MSDGRLKRIADWTVRLGLPIGVFVVVLAVFFSEHMGVLHEVALVSPASAAPGDPLPLRAMVLTDLNAPEGPRIVSLPVDVTLRALDGTTLLERRLEASPVGGADGVIQIPADAPTTVVLRATARRDGEAVATVSRTYELSEAPPPAELVGRLAQATAHFDEGPMELVAGRVPPSAFTSRVVGGACVPEAPCEILVHVGAPAALVRLAPSPAITLGESPSEATAGLARLVLTVHGPDAGVTLEAVRDGAVVARRPLRLPVALATPGLTIEDRVAVPVGAGPTMQVHVVGQPAGFILDAYAAGRWSETASVAASAEPFEGPLRLQRGSSGGLWRVQVRTDRFSSRRAASRFVLRAGSDLEAAIAELDRMAEAPPTPEGPDELRFAWAAAALEVGHYEVPRSVRGYEQDRAVLEARRSKLRVAALLAMLLGLSVLATLLLRRGVGAAREAQRVMEATGDPELATAAHRRRTLLSALAIVATMLLAFVAAGAMIVVRAHLLE